MDECLLPFLTVHSETVFSGQLSGNSGHCQNAGTEGDYMPWKWRKSRMPKEEGWGAGGCDCFYFWDDMQTSLKLQLCKCSLQCKHPLCASCTQALQGLRSWILQQCAGPWPSSYPMLQHNRAWDWRQHPEWLCRGCECGLGRLRAFLLSCGYSEPVASLLWMLMPCSVHT